MVNTASYHRFFFMHFLCLVLCLCLCLFYLICFLKLLLSRIRILRAQFYVWPLPCGTAVLRHQPLQPAGPERQRDNIGSLILCRASAAPMDLLTPVLFSWHRTKKTCVRLQGLGGGFPCPLLVLHCPPRPPLPPCAANDLQVCHGNLGDFIIRANGVVK